MVEMGGDGGRPIAVSFLTRTSENITVKLVRLGGSRMGHSLCQIRCYPLREGWTPFTSVTTCTCFFWASMAPSLPSICLPLPTPFPPVTQRMENKAFRGSGFHFPPLFAQQSSQVTLIGKIGNSRNKARRWRRVWNAKRCDKNLFDIFFRAETESNSASEKEAK